MSVGSDGSNMCYKRNKIDPQHHIFDSTRRERRVRGESKGIDFFTYIECSPTTSRHFYHQHAGMVAFLSSAKTHKEGEVKIH